MGMRTFAREVARNKSYRKCGTTSMFDYYFQKTWRDKGHPACSGTRWARGTKKKRRRGKGLVRMIREARKRLREWRKGTKKA